MFLSDLGNHALLAPDSVQVLSLDRRPDGGAHARVRLRGPLGIRRRALTELLSTQAEANTIAGIARIGRRTVASILWTIESLDEATEVTLCAHVESAGPLDAIVLRAGGRRWITSHFAAALERLSSEVAPGPGHQTEPAPGLERSRQSTMPGCPAPAARGA